MKRKRRCMEDNLAPSPKRAKEENILTPDIKPSAPEKE